MAPAGKSRDQPILEAPTTGLVLRRPLLFFFVLLGVVVFAVTVEQNFAHWRSQAMEPGLGASWIWAADASSPTAFWIARDVELDARRIPGAKISVVADEGYVLWIDGRRVGSRALRAAPSRLGSRPTDVYAVEEFLEPGLNRILVELRSRRGAGGLLFSLRDAQHRPLLVSDGTWRVFRRHHPALLHGWLSLDDLAEELGEELTEGASTKSVAEKPVVWGPPPAGRWRVRVGHELRPTPRVGAATRVRLRPVRVGHTTPGSPWTDLAPDATFRSIGVLGVFDFGEVVQGYLRVGLDRDVADDPAGAGLGLVFLSQDEPPRRDLGSRHPETVILPIPGRDHWRDLHPRRFRYAAVVGVAPRGRVEVEPVSDEEMEAWAPPEGPPAGVFGLRPALGYTPVEEAVWDSLGKQWPE